MPRRFRILRILKWTGTAMCALLLAAFVTGARWQFLYSSKRASGTDTTLCLGRGVFDIALVMASDGRSHPYSRWSVGPSARRDFAEYFWPDYEILRVEPGIFVLRIPLWIPFIAVLLPTLLFWRLDRRRPQPGHCTRCNYNLTGNTTGRCPECGAAVQNATAHGRPVE